GGGEERPAGRLGADRLQELALEDNPIGRRVLFGQARKQVAKQTGGHYPAPLAALEAVRAGYEDGLEAGYAAEAERFGELVGSPVAARLIGICFATTEMKKDGGADAEPHPVGRVGVLGAGLMGGGITYVAAAVAGVPVRVRDKDDESLRRGLGYVRGILDERAARGALAKRAAEDTMALVHPTLDYTGFGTCDLVIEAVFEDLTVKQSVLREVEGAARSETIFASNTSSIPIGRIAERAARPELVCGMHFFSPVHKMPLVEIIVT